MLVFCLWPCLCGLDFWQYRPEYFLLLFCQFFVFPSSGCQSALMLFEILSCIYAVQKVTSDYRSPQIIILYLTLRELVTSQAKPTKPSPKIYRETSVEFSKPAPSTNSIFLLCIIFLCVIGYNYVSLIFSQPEISSTVTSKEKAQCKCTSQFDFSFDAEVFYETFILLNYSLILA